MSEFLDEELKEAVLAVQNITDDLEDAEQEDFGYNLILETNGYCIVIKFLGRIIYSSENDERAYDEDYEYKPIEPFLRDEIRNIIQNLSERLI